MRSAVKFLASVGLLLCCIFFFPSSAFAADPVSYDLYPSDIRLNDRHDYDTVVGKWWLADVAPDSTYKGALISPSPLSPVSSISGHFSSSRHFPAGDYVLTTSVRVVSLVGFSFKMNMGSVYRQHDTFGQITFNGLTSNITGLAYSRSTVSFTSSFHFSSPFYLDDSLITASLADYAVFGIDGRGLYTYEIYATLTGVPSGSSSTTVVVPGYNYTNYLESIEDWCMLNCEFTSLNSEYLALITDYLNMIEDNQLWMFQQQQAIDYSTYSLLQSEFTWINQYLGNLQSYMQIVAEQVPDLLTDIRDRLLVLDTMSQQLSTISQYLDSIYQQLQSMTVNVVGGSLSPGSYYYPLSSFVGSGFYESIDYHFGMPVNGYYSLADPHGDFLYFNSVLTGNTLSSVSVPAGFPFSVYFTYSPGIDFEGEYIPSISCSLVSSSSSVSPSSIDLTLSEFFPGTSTFAAVFRYDGSYSVSFDSIVFSFDMFPVSHDALNYLGVFIVVEDYRLDLIHQKIVSILDYLSQIALNSDPAQYQELVDELTRVSSLYNDYEGNFLDQYHRADSAAGDLIDGFSFSAGLSSALALYSNFWTSLYTSMGEFGLVLVLLPLILGIVVVVIQRGR